MPFKKGVSGNPAGHRRGVKNKASKGQAEILALARSHSPEMIARLLYWARSDRARESVAAAKTLLERAWGQAPSYAEVVTKTLDIDGSRDKIEVTFVMPDPKLWQDDPPPSHYSVHQREMIPHLDERGDEAPARSKLARAMRGDGNTVVLTLVRHASTAMNSDEPGAERVRAWMDLPLSKAGKEEAESTARELRKVDIDVIFHSDLERARATAKAIARTTGAELVEMRKLRPWDLGEMTGKPVKDVAGDIERYACELPDKNVPQGESFSTFRQRLFDGLKSIVEYNAAEPAIIVHNNTERLLKGWVAAGMPPAWKCDPKTLTAKGLSTSAVERVTIDTAALKAVK